MTHLAYCPNKMHELLMRMHNSSGGIPIRNETGLFSSKSPSVFAGAEVIQWILDNVESVDLRESLHIAHLLSANGYIFPIDDHILTIKNDSTFYRFQTKCYWQSHCHKAEENHYAIYLCKRLLQKKDRLRLSDYEAESLRQLQQKYADTWHFIFTRADIESKQDKKINKNEKKILDSQERAFWDLHYPAPGCVNTTEVDMRKAMRMEYKKTSHVIPGCPNTKRKPKESLQDQISFLNRQLERRRQKLSKASESLLTHWKMHSPFDPLLSMTDHGNHWHRESSDYWDMKPTTSAIEQSSYKKWEFSILDLLKDVAGQAEFHKFLQKEFSSENLEFWLACCHLKSLPKLQVKTKVAEIYVEYLVEGAKNAINVDAKVSEIVKHEVVTNPSRYTFDSAEEHIFQLMKTDSYTRFIRSDQYKTYVKKMSERRSLPSKLSLFAGMPLLSPDKEHKQQAVTPQ